MQLLQAYKRKETQRNVLGDCFELANWACSQGQVLAETFYLPALLVATNHPCYGGIGTIRQKILIFVVRTPLFGAFFGLDLLRFVGKGTTLEIIFDDDQLVATKLGRYIDAKSPGTQVAG